ncbi:MAG: HEAT repeat domain-containing protein [Planctomycetes bacterium]|nr:HEAT repeat domain-containing protein [Planctomycetota bacterium]
MAARLAYSSMILMLGSAIVLAGGRVPPRQDMPKYIKMLKTSTSAKDRALAAEMIGRRGQVQAADVKDAVQPLLKTLKNDPSADVRRASAAALGNIATQPKTVLPALVDALKDTSLPVGLAAVGAVSQYGSEARFAIPALRSFAKEKVKDKKKDRNIMQSVNLAIKQINSAGK